MNAPQWLLDAARRRRKKPSSASRNWITDSTAPIPWTDGDAVEAFAVRMNKPLHKKMVQSVQQIGDVEITNAGSDSG
jgi:hypothetical protein